MYENRHQAPLSRSGFNQRLLRHFAVAMLLMLASLGGGMLGYHDFERLPWIDAFLNSAMLLGGMGPVNTPATENGKLFVGLFALYSGMIFLIAMAFVFAPILHRILHRFHWDDKA
ncbi:MAG: hypothetical protein ABIP38_06415 [Steroidobacteraceae bacterium]